MAKGGICVGQTTLQPSCADYVELWEPQPPGILRAFTWIDLPLPFTLIIYFIHIQSNIIFSCTNESHIFIQTLREVCKI